jgi:general secretion pathway protein B
MSYILEALKKLEQKREQEEAPELFIFSRGSLVERRKPSLWPYLLAAALLVNGVAMTWWLSEKHGEKTAPVLEKAPLPRETASSATTVPLARRLSSRALNTGKKRETPREAQQVKPLAAAPPVEAAPAPGRSGQRAAEAPPGEGTPAPAEEARPQEAKAVGTDRTQAEAQNGDQKNKGTEAGALRVNELPAAVRSSLPEFRISGHAYSPDAHTRVARINEKILQEGQELSPGLRLEEIIPHGVVFSYQGYRFRVDLNGNR